jgi:hypothetical protein
MGTTDHATKIGIDPGAIGTLQASPLQFSNVSTECLYHLDQVCKLRRHCRNLFFSAPLGHGQLCDPLFGTSLGHGQFLEALLGVHAQLSHLRREGQQLVGEYKAAKFTPPLRFLLEHTDEIAEFFYRKRHAFSSCGIEK